ncbi:MAG: NTP transferase domain-containing protein [Eubacteriales bacterium]|nr:NTP transferase domain-containing protein [Eubacteriales bacterium]
MNRQVLILRSYLETPEASQREIAGRLGLSLGTVNTLIRECTEQGFLDGRTVTEQGLSFLEPYRVERALIFAAGFGSRFVPITYETPKGLVEVYGEPMLERQIRQLHEAGVTDITVMVGYMKEKFEYLIDKFGVKLLYNPEYAVKNTLATMYHAFSVLAGKNCYLLNSDNWLRENLYHGYEGGAWYSAAYAEGSTPEWVLLFDGKDRRIRETFPGGRDCWYMYGPAYFSREFSAQFLPVLKRYYEMPGTDQYYWEHVLMEMLNGQAKRRCTAYFGTIKEADTWKNIEIHANCQPENTVYEFENIEELRKFDDRYIYHSGSRAMELVSEVFQVPESEIQEIRCLKAGMTNNSWLFSVKGRSYICRIPGEGTDLLINRREEKEAYDAVSKLGLTDELIYFNADTGYKISVFYEGARNADPKNEADMRACMKKLHILHESGIRVSRTFDIWERIEYYERLCEKAAKTEAAPEGVIPFADYKKVRAQAGRIADYLERLPREKTIAHIDSVADNFLFLPGAEQPGDLRDPEKVRLIDWEYCGMCDPLIDISMCSIYSFLNEAEAEHLLRLYLEREPSEEEERVFWAYMALGGLLWALWAVYKEELGVQFSDYTIRMYRYCKTYYRKLEKILPNPDTIFGEM